jgi:multidrug efflux pump subunit AcrA (membrane-fusion protein)
VLPESAVLSDDQGNYVYVIDKDDKVQRRSVKIGDVSDTGMAVLSGLQGNERVVYSAGAFLNVGEKIIPEIKRN